MSVYCLCSLHSRCSGFGQSLPLCAHLGRSMASGRPSNADVRRPINLSENRCADSKPNSEMNR